MLANTYVCHPCVRARDPCFCHKQAALSFADVIPDSFLHYHFFTSFFLDLVFKKENMILENVLISMSGLLLF